MAGIDTCAPFIMGSVLKFPGESCFVIKVMGYKKARLWMRVIGIEGGSWRFPKPYYAILLFSERPAFDATH